MSGLPPGGDSVALRIQPSWLANVRCRSATRRGFLADASDNLKSCPLAHRDLVPGWARDPNLCVTGSLASGLSNMSAKHVWAICINLVLAMPMLAASLAGLLEARYPMVSAPLGESGWGLKMYGDGSASMSFGHYTFEDIEVPAGTFPVAKRLADFQKAVDLAGPTPDYQADPDAYESAWSKADFSISRLQSPTNHSKTEIAVFTPEIKAYCDRILSAVTNQSTSLSSRVPRIIAEHPVFSEKLMRSLAASTNLLQRGANLSPNSRSPEPVADRIQPIRAGKEPSPQSPRKP